MTRPVIALLFGVGFGALTTAVILQKNKKNNCNTDIQTGGNKEEIDIEVQEFIIIDKKNEKGEIIEEIVLSDKKNKYGEEFIIKDWVANKKGKKGKNYYKTESLETEDDDEDKDEDEDEDEDKDEDEDEDEDEKKKEKREDKPKKGEDKPKKREDKPKKREDKPKKREDKLCSELEDKAEKNACNSFYFILLNRNKNNSKKDIVIASFIAKKVFLEELEKKKELHTCRSIAIWIAERYLKKKL